MSRKKKNPTLTLATDVMARQRREALLAALADGRPQRATRIPDGKKKASREACRRRGGRWD